jgi:hypothetical protein
MTTISEGIGSGAEARLHRASKKRLAKVAVRDCRL